ncbi:MAG: hypothetical protein JNM94_16435 [Phycisphaerae bacterium]|nr:hypothetical protein [Phycisphaerae bacterium]
MPDLAKPSGSPPSGSRRGPHDEPPPTRVVVVRDDPSRIFKNVRPDDGARSGARVGFWTSIVVGIVAFLWLTGHVGETHGFARVIGVPDLVTSSDMGLVSGIRIALAAPLRVFQMALANPMLLAAAFILVTLPAAGLSVAAPRSPGGPRPSKLATTFAWLGLIGAACAWSLLVTWTALPSRRAGLIELPLDRATFPAWASDLAATAGFDAFAFVASALWLVLLIRLPLPRVAVAFAAVAGFVATFVTWTGFATSNGIADAVSRDRATVTMLAIVDSGSSLAIGTVEGRLAIATDADPPTIMAVPAPEFAITGRSSLATWLTPKGTE